MRLSDRVSGVGLMGLGALAAVFGSRMPGVPGQDVGPSVFPMTVGAGLVITGAMIAFGIGHTFEVPDEEEGPPRPRWYGLRALIPPALLVFYVLAVEPLGFLVTAALIVLAAALTMGATWRLAVPLALFAPPFVHAVFYKLLRVPLPEGLLAAPW